MAVNQTNCGSLCLVIAKGELVLGCGNCFGPPVPADGRCWGRGTEDLIVKYTKPPHPWAVVVQTSLSWPLLSLQLGPGRKELCYT